MNSVITKTNFSVTSADTDMYARLRVGALVNMFIQSAIQSADQLGFGFTFLRKQNLFWVLSRLSVEITNPLKWYDDVEIETWPKDVDRFLYLRDFLVRNKQQKIVARATSGWLAIDRSKKRPGRIDGLNTEYFHHLKNYHAIKQPPGKIEEITKGESSEIKTTCFDIDLNKHVTATRYVDWMLDTFTPEFHKSSYPKNLTVNYMKETMPGEKIQLLKDTFSTNKYVFEGKNTNSGTVAFRGMIEF